MEPGLTSHVPCRSYNSVVDVSRHESHRQGVIKGTPGVMDISLHPIASLCEGRSLSAPVENWALLHIHSLLPRSIPQPALKHVLQAAARALEAAALEAAALEAAELED